MASLQYAKVPILPFQVWLREQRRLHKWSLNELARRMNVSPNTAHGWQHGRILPGPDYEVALAEATGVSLERVRSIVWESRRIKGSVGRAAPLGYTPTIPAVA